VEELVIPGKNSLLRSLDALNDAFVCVSSRSKSLHFMAVVDLKPSMLCKRSTPIFRSLHNAKRTPADKMPQDHVISTNEPNSTQVACCRPRKP